MTDSLLTEIQQNITSLGNGAITGEVLRTVLDDMFTRFAAAQFPYIKVAAAPQTVNSTLLAVDSQLFTPPLQANSIYEIRCLVRWTQQAAGGGLKLGLWNNDPDSDFSWVINGDDVDHVNSDTVSITASDAGAYSTMLRGLLISGANSTPIISLNRALNVGSDHPAVITARSMMMVFLLG